MKYLKEIFLLLVEKKETINEILNNKDNIFIEKKNENNEIIGVSIINKNTILMLCVEQEYRGKGIGKNLLIESEKLIKNNGYNEIIVGVGFNYLAPGIPTSKKYTESVHEKLYPSLNDSASSFFEKRGYYHSWGDCNCFDMNMSLSDFDKNNNSVGDTINGIEYRWANHNDINNIVECVDDACQYQNQKFSKYYTNDDLYKEDSSQKVLVALKNNKIIGTLIISIETEGKDLGCVGCTCV